MKKFCKKTYYENKVQIMTPYGIAKIGMVFSGEQWEDILVYGIGNCGIDSMFKKVDKPIETSVEEKVESK